MDAPNYQNYNLVELHEALAGLDAKAYPEREQALREEIARRKTAGFSLSGEWQSLAYRERHVSLWDIALPVWWHAFWRTTVASIVLAIGLGFLLGLLANALGLPQTAIQAISTAVWLVSVPVLGAFFMRHALVARYTKFHLEVAPKGG